MTDTLHGPAIEAEGVRFRLWAPGCDAVSLVLEQSGDEIAMTRDADGFHSAVAPGTGPGTLYRFRLPDGLAVPDPASRFQPQDVHGPSEVIDGDAYRWTEQWSGVPWHEVVLYELHVGTFTPEGTFLAVIDKLDHLKSLGITAIEIMPVSDFPGKRNWGYDGVLPYAPDSAYGRPDDLKALVEAAHTRGIAVLLDVVYNHFGPDGNYLPAYAPDFFTERHHTPWGAGVNFDGDASGPVRDFIIMNALSWIEEFHLDGLRFDAVHAIMDDSGRHVLDEIAERLRASTTRPIHLILENEDNDPSRLGRENNKPTHYTAQWNDDVHHVLHVAATHETSGYYADYEGNTELLGRALAEGFGYQGQMMPYRGSPRGEPCAHLPPGAFVAFIQNHDQIGNRAFGDRLTASVPAPKLDALAALYLLLPQTPMLFMGEEWGAKEPFPFFCDFQGDLAEAVRKGRREEFKRFPEFEDPAVRDKIPDPLADKTFESAKLDWNAFDGERLELYRSLIAARRTHIVPLLDRITRGGNAKVLADGAVAVRWSVGTDTLLLQANLSDTPVPVQAGNGTLIWQQNASDHATLGPWVVRWTLERS